MIMAKIGLLTASNQKLVQFTYRETVTQTEDLKSHFGKSRPSPGCCTHEVQVMIE